MEMVLALQRVWRVVAPTVVLEVVVAAPGAGWALSAVMEMPQCSLAVAAAAAMMQVTPPAPAGTLQGLVVQVTSSK